MVGVLLFLWCHKGAEMKPLDLQQEHQGFQWCQKLVSQLKQEKLEKTQCTQQNRHTLNQRTGGTEGGIWKDFSKLWF